LMGRKSMHDDHGMLFMFMEDGQHAFWMKNTYIPLDIIFLGKDMRVSDMKKNFEPCASSNCRVFTPRTNVKYVLEVNAGFADRNGIEYGSQMKIY
ncbi:DUF192 domain-containing protein, partial [Candidatus Woesearchaeota archaeon]|nr:DUF192 domain-containing protein [Candidatus Woesearchaeota archaeon]